MKKLLLFILIILPILCNATDTPEFSKFANLLLEHEKLSKQVFHFPMPIHDVYKNYITRVKLIKLADMLKKKKVSGSEFNLYIGLYVKEAVEYSPYLKEIQAQYLEYKLTDSEFIEACLIEPDLDFQSP